MKFFPVFSISLILTLVTGQPLDLQKGCVPTNTPSPLNLDPESFLSQLSPQARQQYNDIMNNDSLTPNQIEQQLEQWARVNNIQNEFNKYQKEQKTFLDKLNVNIRLLVGNIPNVLDQLIGVISNKNNSVKLQKEAIERLSKQYPEEMTALFILSTLTVEKMLPSGSSRSTTRSLSSTPTTTRSFPTFPWNRGSSTPSTPTTRRFPPFPTSQRPWF